MIKTGSRVRGQFVWLSTAMVGSLTANGSQLNKPRRGLKEVQLTISSLKSNLCIRKPQSLQKMAVVFVGRSAKVSVNIGHPGGCL